MRLHRHVRGAGRAVDLLHDHVGLREALLYVAVTDAEAVADIGARDRPDVDRDRVLRARRRLAVQQWRAGSHGFERVEDRRALLVGDVDAPGRGARRSARRRGDGGDHVADMTRDVGEYVLVLDLAPVPAQPLDVIGPEHDDLVGDRRRVERDHPRVRVRRAHEGGVEHARPLDLDRITKRTGHARVHDTSS